jgi:hypothetical protein
MEKHRQYVVALFALLGFVLLSILAMNLQLERNDLGGNRKAFLASRWQQKTQGVTYSPPLSSTRLFKLLRLDDRLPGINTVIFGSSTAMGVRPDMLPAQMKAYNFSQTGNPLFSVIGEAEYIEDHYPNIVNFVIPLDWSLNFLYMKEKPVEADLSPPRLGQERPGPPLFSRIKDAMSLPRIQNLGVVLKDILKSKDRISAARQIFFEASSGDYRCPDGETARDYDTMYRGTCTGFRFDGSATFANLDRVSEHELPSLVLSATIPSSKYSAALKDSKGEPNPAILEGLSKIVQKAKGKVIFFMPPLIPGMERKFLSMPGYAEDLERTKAVMDAWAKKENVTIIDAGQSEKYGCRASEFVDQHHAVYTCYEKIFEKYRQDGENVKGLYAP